MRRPEYLAPPLQYSRHFEQVDDAAVRRRNPQERVARQDAKLADGGGVYLEMRPNGSRYWRLKYRHSGKEKLPALGV
ncbi:Arm DNA-binding domain-containing protein [Paraburkholderia domus]|uniref:Arm DNA-binding domain-containing protein n=1 Tax=Paraburkholderia domus TaxID=2793075 RepID=UPI002E2C4821|nr:Arm DNA-binding domain-containing protein [Paraburkholderia domus]